MGKAKANSKAAEKKRERLEMEKKMNARVAIVKTANSTSDPLENLPSFSRILSTFFRRLLRISASWFSCYQNQIKFYNCYHATTGALTYAT